MFTEEFEKKYKELFVKSKSLDLKKLPMKIREVVENVLIPQCDFVPPETLTLTLIAHIAKMGGYNRVKIKSFQILGDDDTTLANVYAIIFLTSGGGKDKPIQIIKWQLMKEVNRLQSERLNANTDKIIEQLKIAAEKKFVYKKDQSEYIKKHEPRVMVLESGNATTEGFIDERVAYMKMEFGGTFLIMSEFGDFLSNSREKQLSYLSLVTEVFDNGNSRPKVIKSEKSSFEVLNVPHSCLLHTSLYGLTTGENQKKLYTFFNRGMARRSIVCMPEELSRIPKNIEYNIYIQESLDKIKKSKRDYSKYEKYFTDAYLKTISQIGDKNNVFVLKDEVELFLKSYETYCIERSESILIKQQEGLKAEIAGRYWIANKLAGVIAFFEHPDQKFITLEDIVAAVYLIEFYGNHFAEFYKLSDVNPVETLYQMMKSTGNWYSISELSKSKIVYHGKFYKWFKEIKSILSERAIEDGYKLEKMKQTNRGEMYRVVESEGEELAKIIDKLLKDDVIRNELNIDEIKKLAAQQIQNSKNLKNS